MLATKKAIYALLTSDATLMGMLEQSPYMGRLPDTAKITREKGAISIDGSTSLVRGDKEEQTFTLNVWTLTHDKAEAIYDRLMVVLHPSLRATNWRPLIVSQAKAVARMESAIDVPDPTSELFHKAVRFRVLFARRMT